MTDAGREIDSEPGFRALLGLVVLAIAAACANIAALPIDQEPFTGRLALEPVRRMFVAGYFAQIAAGIWLALALLLDLRRAIRPALLCWLGALCLMLAPVPPIAAEPLAAAVPVAGVLLVTLVGWALDQSLREQPA